MGASDGGRRRRSRGGGISGEPNQTRLDTSIVALEPSSTGGGLKGQAIRSFVWTGFQTVSVRLLSLVTFIVLARLLTPHDFGVAAMAGVFTTLSALLAAGGFSQAIVQKETLEAEDVDSVFWVGMVVGVTLTTLTVILAWPLADFFRVPELKAALWVLSPMFLVIAITSPHLGLLQRAFRFATLARVAVSGNIAATVVGVSAALAGAGYWSLIIQTLMVPVWTSVAVWSISDYRPGFRVSSQRFRDLFRISRQFMGDRLMTFFYEQTDKAVIGRELGTAVLGVYSVAYRLIFVMLDVLVVSVQAVALPAFSRAQRDGKRLANGYLTAIRLCTTVSMPIFMFVAVAAHDVVVVLFGSEWLAAVPAMQIFCAYGAVQSFLAYNTVFLQAVGYARTVFWLAAAGTAVQIGMVVLAVQHGTTWVAATFLIRACVMTPVVVGVIGRVLRPGVLGAVLRTVSVPGLGSLLLGLVTAGLVNWNALGSPWAALALALPTGVLVYLAVLRLAGPQHLRELRAVAGMMRGRSAAQ